MNGLNQYRSYQVQTSAPEDQIALLYDGARRFVDQAAAAVEAQDYPLVSEKVGKAQRIFTELTAMLNFEAGEVADNLARLYEYWNWRLTQGLIHKDVEAFREVSATVADLGAAWAEAAKAVRAQRSGQALG